MPTYETLDAIADAYTPLLAAIFLLLLVRAATQRRWLTVGAWAALMFTGLVITYGLMFLDMQFGFWPALGLDYSTHTALAAVLTVLLAVMARRFAVLWGCLFLAYVGLMLYQRYHAWRYCSHSFSSGSLLLANHLPVLSQH